MHRTSRLIAWTLALVYWGCGGTGAGQLAEEDKADGALPTDRRADGGEPAVTDAGLEEAGDASGGGGDAAFDASLEAGDGGPLLDAGIATDAGSDAGALLFHSGFEGTVAVVAANAQNDRVVGEDPTKVGPNNWVADFENAPGIGSVAIAYEEGTATQRKANVIAEPGQPENHVLQYWLPEANVTSPHKGRIQMSVYGNSGLRELFVSTRLFLPASFDAYRTYPAKSDWLTLAEFWNNGGWTKEPFPFRISLNVGKPSASVPSDLFFEAHGQRLEVTDAGKEKWTSVWEAADTSFPIPTGQWLRLDTYFKEGNGAAGRFYFAVTPEGGATKVLLDVHNFTHHPSDPSPDGLSHMNPLKLYTSAALIEHFASKGAAMEVWWDDFEVWKGRRPSGG